MAHEQELSDGRSEIDALATQFAESNIGLGTFLHQVESGLYDSALPGVRAKATLSKLKDESVTEVTEALEEALKPAWGKLADMALIYLIAMFEAFLGDLIRTVVRLRPEMLKSGKQVTAEDVVQADSKDDLIAMLAEREVDSLRKRSFADTIDRLRERFGLDVADASVDTDRLVEFHARRNILVHAGGKVDEAYLRLAPESELEVGERIETQVSEVEQLRMAFLEVATQLATDAKDRFFRNT